MSETRSYGFSEEALRGLEDLDRRRPPDVQTRSLGAGERDRQGRPHYWGHRQRLRERFATGGHKAMPDYELLEMLLFSAIPRIDTKPLAKYLLATFGDLGSVLAASRHRLMQMDGVDDRVVHQLRLTGALAERVARAKVMDRCVISSWEDLIDYCRTVMAHRETEQFRILFLDAKNGLVADEEQARGTVNHVPVYPREVAKRALELNASALILVHNHPSGDPTPSDEDVSMTMRIETACDTIGVGLHDHVVIGRASEASFRSLGLL